MVFDGSFLPPFLALKRANELIFTVKVWSSLCVALEIVIL